MMTCACNHTVGQKQGGPRGSLASASTPVSIHKEEKPWKKAFQHQPFSLSAHACMCACVHDCVSECLHALRAYVRARACMRHSKYIGHRMLSFGILDASILR